MTEYIPNLNIPPNSHLNDIYNSIDNRYRHDNRVSRVKKKYHRNWIYNFLRD